LSRGRIGAGQREKADPAAGAAAGPLSCQAAGPIVTAGGPGAVEAEPLRFRVFVAPGTPLHAALAALPAEARPAMLLRMAPAALDHPVGGTSGARSATLQELVDAVHHLAEAVGRLAATRAASDAGSVAAPTEPTAHALGPAGDPRLARLHAPFEGDGRP